MESQNFGFRIWNKQTYTYMNTMIIRYKAPHISYQTSNLAIADDGEHLTIELWSGLTDCYGVRIYEGDWIKITEVRRVNVCVLCCFSNSRGFYFEDKNGEIINKTIIYKNINYAKVIGNKNAPTKEMQSQIDSVRFNILPKNKGEDED